MKRILFLIIIIIFYVSKAGAEIYKGKKVLQFGDSAEALGRAGTGVASSGVDFLYLNPASIADAERLSMSIQYGTLPLPTRFNDVKASFAFPTSYGVFGASLRYMYFPNSNDFRQGYAVTIASARDITRQLMLGFSINFFYGNHKGNMYYTGGTLGFMYKFPSTANKYGFCLYHPQIGLSTHFGYPFGDHRSYSDLNEITLGYNFIFFNIKHFNIRFFNDFTVLNYREFPVKIGLESELFNWVIVRGGYVIPHSYNDGNFTAGAGVKFGVESFKGSINYAINFYRDMKYTHYLGVKFEYGKLDENPPETDVKSDKEYISPNHDGIKDYVLFKLSVKDQSRIKGWKLQILDVNNQIIKDYSISERDIVDRLTPDEFFKRLFQKRESTVVPERVVWDGTGIKGEPVSDGKYYFVFNAWDARDNISINKTGMVIVDNTPPEVILEKTDEFFSPNNDGKKDVLTINQKIKTAPDDIWIAGFKDITGTIVKHYQWEGNIVPRTVTWDGKDDTGVDAPEGLYMYFIICTDKAGNHTLAEIKEITLTRQYEIVDITLSSKYFSYNYDTVLNLFPYLSSTQGLFDWKITVFNFKMKIIKEITGVEIVPKMIQYDCTNNEGNNLDDGVYYVKFFASFRSGNAPESYEKMFIIDSTPPKVSVSHAPGLFSPDGDRENDILIIKTKVKEDTGIKSWNILIYASSGEIFKSFSGSGPVPEEILWDGLSDKLDIVESAADYTIVLEAVDLAGNKGISSPDRLAVDVLVIVTERGLKIRISNIEFPFGSESIKFKGKVILDRVFQILQKYETYNIIIEGHTDDVGKEEYNLELSERRAKSVNDYLVSKGIRSDRLKFVGMGETMPLYPNDNDENRRRNRRVEFILIKKDRE